MAFCGLTQAKLDEKGWINSDQKCTAKCAGGVECSKYYSEHSATQTGNSVFWGPRSFVF